MLDSFVFLPLSTRAYSKGRAYVKIILKNHARSYFACRSYYRGNTVLASIYCNEQNIVTVSIWNLTNLSMIGYGTWSRLKETY